ncbi:ATP-binding protein [Demequina sp. TTPB684]|uniref:sensor histidine kinase n=1 Tax=unclassified Demequina TaxID=2620311 RepID=UPI001CF143AE|nr:MULTISPECIES: ATP-binding protein [unclassified Demequina]MCB2412469.1 ATP-binding protein [Demequina sp. TTPB684]UPU87698.1 ATP-binding protein [Demequina sp. TMPB413]
MSAPLTHVDRVSEDTARARLERLLYSSVGFAALIYGGVLYAGSGGISGQTPQLAPWYGWGLIAIAIVMPATLGILTWVMSRRAVRRFAGTTALLFLVSMMVFPFGLSTPTLMDNATPWYQGIHALHGMIAATAWQRRSIWVYGLGHGVIIGVVQNAVREDATKAAFLDGAGSLVFIIILMAATLGVVGAADRLDHASELARAQAARTAAGRTREREETRINAMVHDDIMSVLLTASRENPPDSLRDQARVAIASITSLETRDASARVYSNKETAQALLEVVERVAPLTQVVHQEAGDIEVPADVVTALSDALAEALRNSVRHAGLEGGDVPRRVTIAADDRGLVVTMEDEGKGFNTRAVQSRRLGISLSIIERMSMVEGGSGDVASRLGEGTTVTLTWVRPS